MRPICSSLALAATALLSFVADAQALTSAEAIAKLNAQRAAHALPPVTEAPELTAACAAGVHYVALNGPTPGAPHEIIEGRPGATPEAAWGLGHAVLAPYDPLRETNAWHVLRPDLNPWEFAPAHLSQVLDPTLLTTGYAEEGGERCLIVHSEPRRALTGLHVYPADGAEDVPYALTADEFDSAGRRIVPGTQVGLPAGTTTGPYLYTWPAGIRSASLTGPGGAVDVRVVPSFVIPVRPLRANARYTATVVVDDPVAGTQQRRWSFRTGTRTSRSMQRESTLGLPERVDGRTLRVRVPEALASRRARLVVDAYPACAAGRRSWSVTCDKLVRHVRRRLTMASPTTTITLPRVGRRGAWSIELWIDGRPGMEPIGMVQTYRAR